MHIMHVALGGCLKAPPVPYGLTEDTGGHIAYVLGAAEAQARRDDVARVSVVTRLFRSTRLGPAFAAPVETTAGGVRILRLATANDAYLCKEALEAELPALTEAFLDLLRDPARRPDVLHAHFADAAELARAAQAEYGLPFLYTPHSLALGKADVVQPEASARVRRESRAIEAAAAIVVSSRDEAERQVEAYGRDAGGWTHRVNPGTCRPVSDDTAAAEALIAPFLRAPERPMVLAIARPVEKKNLAGLVQAYAATPALQERANLVILPGLRDGLSGGAPEQDRIVADLFDLIDRHDLWGRVAVPRRHSQAEVEGLYRLAARSGGVFVNPAHHEPFGLTLIEAVQSGLPFVATADGGPVDIAALTGGGTVVPPRDTAALARACLDWLDRGAEDPRPAAAAARARRLFSWDAWAARVQEIAADVVAPPRAGAGRRTPAARLLACDLDNTLTGCAEGAAAFRARIEAAPPRLRFLIATGRSIGEARRELASWHLPEPEVFIASVGTEIWRRATDGRFRLDPAYGRRISDDWRPEDIADALAPLGLQPQAACERRRWKQSFLGDARAVRRIESALAQARLPARVILSHDRLIDVIPLRAGKAAALGHVAADLGLGMADCIACGDSGNDLDMLTLCGAAIVPANAHPEIAHLSRPELYRSPLPHARGVLDGLARLDLHTLPRLDLRPARPRPNVPSRAPSRALAAK